MSDKRFSWRGHDLSEQTFGAAQKCLISELGLRDLALVPVVELELEPLALLEAEVDHELRLEGRVGVVVDLLGASWNANKDKKLISQEVLALSLL